MARRNFGEKLLDDRWVLTDQVVQLKGVVEYNERNKQWVEQKDELVTQLYDEKLKLVTSNVKKLRQLIKKILSGHEEELESLLKKDKEIYMICRKKSPEEIIESLKHLLFRQRKAFDKVKAEISNTKKELFDVEMNIAILKDNVKAGSQYISDQKRLETQKNSAALEYTNTQIDVCNIIEESYNKIMGVLKKDSLYYDEVITNLKNDANIQSETILKILELGQLAREDLTWLKQEEKKSAVRFTVEANEHRKAIKEMARYCQDLEKMKARLHQYGAKSYPMFQEVVKEPDVDPEEVKAQEKYEELDKEFNDLEDILGANGITNVYSEIEKLKTTKFILNELIAENKQEVNEKRAEYDQLKALSQHLDNLFPEEVKTFIKQEEAVMEDVDQQAKGLQKVKIKEDELKEGIQKDTLLFKDFKRMLWPIELGAPDRMTETYDDQGRVIEDKMDYYNREDPFNLFAPDTSERRSQTTEEKHDGDQDSTCESDEGAIPLKLMDIVFMKAQALHDSIGDKGTEDECNPEVLLAYGDMLAQEQVRRDAMLSAMLDEDKLNLRSYKPKFADGQETSKGCEKKSRLELKFASRQLIVDNEKAKDRGGDGRIHLHPQGVYRGMYIPKGSSESSEEDKMKGDQASEEGAEEESDIGLEESEEEEPDPDLNPWDPKPHICY